MTKTPKLTGSATSNFRPDRYTRQDPAYHDSTMQWCTIPTQYCYIVKMCRDATSQQSVIISRADSALSRPDTHRGASHCLHRLAPEDGCKTTSCICTSAHGLTKEARENIDTTPAPRIMQRQHPWAILIKVSELKNGRIMVLGYAQSSAMLAAGGQRGSPPARQSSRTGGEIGRPTGRHLGAPPW